MSEHGPTQLEHLNGSSPPTTLKSEAIEALKAGETIAEVAKRFKLVPSTVAYWKKTQLPPSSKRDAQLRKAEEMLKQGASGPAVRAKIGLSGTQLKRLRDKLGIKVKPRGRSFVGASTRLEALRPKAEEMFRGGATLRSVQAALAVSVNTALNWRKATKGLPPPRKGRPPKNFKETMAARKPKPKTSEWSKRKMGEWSKDVRAKMPSTAAEALAMIPPPKVTSLQGELRRLVVRHGAVEIRKVLEEIESALLRE